MYVVIRQKDYTNPRALVFRCSKTGNTSLLELYFNSQLPFFQEKSNKDNCNEGTGLTKNDFIPTYDLEKIAFKPSEMA